MSAFTAADIKDLRCKHDLTQEKLADTMSVTVTTVQNWESGSSNVSTYNQEKLSKLDRGMSIDRIFKTNSFTVNCIECNSLHALLRNMEDEVAIGLAEHFVNFSEPNTIKRALMEHFASLTYILTGRGSETALSHARNALNILSSLEDDKESSSLVASVENAVIGEGVDRIIESHDSFMKQRMAVVYCKALIKLYEKRSLSDAQYLWNALGLACNVSLDDQKTDALKALIEAVGIKEVKRRVFSFEHLVGAKTNLESILEGAGHE